MPTTGPFLHDIIGALQFSALVPFQGVPQARDRTWWGQRERAEERTASEDRDGEAWVHEV